MKTGKKIERRSCGWHPYMVERKGGGVGDGGGGWRAQFEFE